MKIEREDGFSLIEVLVGIIIIGILAGVAIGITVNQRKKAVFAQQKTEVSGLATETNDTLSRSLDATGYSTKYNGLTADQATKTYHNATFKWEQFGYPVIGGAKEAITNPAKKYFSVCQQLTQIKDSTKVVSVTVSKSGAQTVEGACA